MQSDSTAIVLLAAGGSTRFGSPKQLAEYDGTTLIKHVAVTAILSDFPTVVVLGNAAEDVEKELADLLLETVLNEDWESGLSSSIKSGLETVRESHPGIGSVILMLCDQPEVSTYTLLKLVEMQAQCGKPIVASKYEDTLGVPAIFGSEMFDELLSLEGDSGAKELIEKFEDTHVGFVDAPEAAYDVDTPEDLERQPETELP